MIFDRIELSIYDSEHIISKQNLIIDKIDPRIIKNEIDVLKDWSSDKTKKLYYY